MRLRALVLAAVLCLPAPVALAQTAPDAGSTAETADGQVVRTPILVFDRDRIIANSRAGAALIERIEAMRAALIAENDRIFTELQAEELALTEERATLDAAAFRLKADAFDEKVVRIRAEQDAKSEEIQSAYEAGLDEVEAEMNEALGEVAGELGALVVFERSQVYLLSGSIDVSARIIARMNGTAMPGADAD